MLSNFSKIDILLKTTDLGVTKVSFDNSSLTISGNFIIINEETNEKTISTVFNLSDIKTYQTIKKQ